MSLFNNTTIVLPDEMLLSIANASSSPLDAKNMLLACFDKEVMIIEMKKRMKTRKDCLVFFDEFVWDLKSPLPYYVVCRLPTHVMDAMIDWIEPQAHLLLHGHC